MNRKKGFTLVELIIVIAVIGVLAAILIPIFSNIVEKSNEKSALSDARNVLTNLIEQMTADDTQKIPDMVAFAIKGGKIYGAGYSSKDGSTFECGANAFDYNENASLASNSIAILGGLMDAGAVLPNPDRSVEAFTESVLKNYIEKAGFDTANIVFYADYIIDKAMFSENEEVTVATVPNDPVSRQVVISPTYDELNEIYTYTVTTADIAAMGYGDDSAIKLDTALIEEALRTKAISGGTDRWYGYGIKLVDNTGMDYSVLRTEFKSDELSQYRAGSMTLPAAAYPLITKSVAFTDYMTNTLHYSDVTETTVADYISKANGGTLIKTYADYLTEEYGASIPVDIMANEVTKGDTIGTNKHVETEVAKKIFNFMYSEGYLFSFLPNSNARAFSDYYNAYTGSQGNVTAGWKTAGSVKFYSIFDALDGDVVTDLNVTGSAGDLVGAIMFAWHNDIVPQGTEYLDMPSIEIFVEPHQ